MCFRTAGQTTSKGTPAVVAKWISRIGNKLSPAQRLKIGEAAAKNVIGAAAQKVAGAVGTTFDSAVDYTVNVMKNLNDCK